MLVQNHKRVVLTVKEHEEGEGVVQPVQDITEAQLVSGSEPVHLVEPET